jgi:uncharacterized delta-60 repeat protein
MQNSIKLVLIVLVVVGFLIGCSSGGHNASPVVPDETSSPPEITGNSITADINTHYLLTYSLINIDATNPDDVKAEIIPARLGSVHINILKFLEFAPCTDCLKIVGVSYPEPGTLDVDIEITHPFDDMNFTAFDVRGIVMFNGSYKFPASGLTMPDSSMGDGELLNAEGLTQLFNGSTLGMAGDLFAYYKGKMATPTVPNADLNGFIRHITDDPTNTRNALYAGDSVTRTYSLALPNTEFVLGYAVDASWDVPTVDPVTDPMTQFPATANCIEPWKIEASSNLYGGGGPIPFLLTIDVYDWQGKDTISTVLVECPELFTGQKSASFIEIIPWYARYEVWIYNFKGAPPGTYKVLISAEAVENATSPDWIDLTAQIIIEVIVPEPAPGSLIWAKQAGGTPDDEGYSITTLSDNSTVVTGSFGGSATFGPGEPNQTVLTCDGDWNDIFIARYNQDGTLAWAKRAGGNSDDTGFGITTLSDNSTVVTGFFSDSATFGPGEPNETVLTSAGYEDIFVARYNPDGTLAWAKWAGGASDPYWNTECGSGITALSDNSTVVTGWFYGSATFGPGEPNEIILTASNLTFSDFFIARYNPDGTLAWAKRAGGDDWFDQGYGITTLSDNSTVVTGTIGLSATFGSGEPNETVLTNGQLFIARYNLDGTLAWAKRAGGDGPACGYGISTLSDNSTVVTGCFYNSATFGPGEANETILTSAGHFDIFIARYNTDGTLAWVKRAGGPTNWYTYDKGFGITTLLDNSTVVTGTFSFSATFGPGEPNQTVLTDNGYDIFIARYNPDGTLAWAKSAGGEEGTGVGFGISALSDNSTVVTGWFGGQLAIFGKWEPNETELEPAGHNDIFVARFMP